MTLLVSFSCTLLIASNALAVTLHEDDFSTFLKNSRENPKQVFMLKVSETWCGPCKKETKVLLEYPATETTALNRAYWNEIQKDKLPNGQYEEFLKKVGIPDSDTIPFNIAFKNGVPVGSISGFEIEKLKNFVSDAEAYNSGSSTNENSMAMLIPKFSCGPKQAGEASVIGVSGYQSQKDTDTDDFGRSNLIMYADLFKNPRSAKLLAPPIPGTSKKSTPSGHGVFYIQNPFLPIADTFADPKTAEADIGNLCRASGENVRIIFTGHGGPEGMAVGYEKRRGKSYTDTINFDAAAFEESVTMARRARKSVRGVLVQCYGGQYAEAFMPLDGVASNACAAFASLPEKESEGCYSSAYSGTRNDYLGIAAKLKKCDGSQTARDLHYRIVAEAAGHDVPMLSSEYFLLYGEAAKKLSRDEVVDPIKAVSRIELKSGATIYINRLNNTVFKAIYEGKSVDLPKAVLADCNRNAYGGVMDWEAPDHKHFSLFYLWARSVGPKAKKLGDCTPIYRLIWDSKKASPPSELVSFHFDSGDTTGLTEAEKTIDVSGLKPEARLLISRILPYFYVKGGAGDSGKFVRDMAAEIQKFDPAKADAILRLLGRVEDENKAAGYGRDLAAAMLYNLSSAEIRSQNIGLQRLAHLVGSVIAELELRMESKNDSSAAALVEQLEAMKECEKDIL